MFFIIPSVGGYCNNPNECICYTGFRGGNCDICEWISHIPITVAEVLNLLILPSPLFMYTCTNPLDLPCQNQSLCQNGATCVNDINGASGHTCVCPPGYMGSSCQLEIDECSPSTCQNGGSCTVSVLEVADVAITLVSHLSLLLLIKEPQTIHK